MNKFKSFIVKHSKLLIVAFGVAVVSSVAAMVVVAYLNDQTAVAVNTMTPANVSTEIKEDPFEGSVKTNVQIKNTGTMSAFIRVQLIPTWEDKNGNPVGVNAALSDLDIIWGDNFDKNWTKGTDACYYYNSAVEPNGLTSQLIKKAVVAETSTSKLDKYNLNLTILAEGLQSTPNSTADNVWSTTIYGTDEGEAVK